MTYGKSNKGTKEYIQYNSLCVKTKSMHNQSIYLEENVNTVSKKSMQMKTSHHNGYL